MTIIKTLDLRIWLDMILVMTYIVTCLQEK
jgi:hypothetical protein